MLAENESCVTTDRGIRAVHLMSSVSRDAGGLFCSVKRLSQALSEAGVAVSVFGLRDEHYEQDVSTWQPLSPRVFAPLPPKAFGYAHRLARELSAAPADVLHLHGMWTYPSLAVRRWTRRTRRPYLISAHGMVDPWALRNSAWKKRLARLLYENANLRGAACLRALCGSEAEAMRAIRLQNPICIVPNGIDIPSQANCNAPAWRRTLPDGAKALLYLGRIHPKKGLSNLLEAWRQSRESVHGHANQWHLVIAGWEQGGHESELRQQTQECGIPSVHFIGPQFDEDKESSYAHADGFILPSFSEGMPMVILEAWAYGKPVLMTPQCNMPDGFAAGAAVRIDPEPKSIAAGLRSLFEMTDAQRQSMGQQGLALVKQRYTWTEVARQMREVYEWVLGGGAPPACVEFA